MPQVKHQPPFSAKLKNKPPIKRKNADYRLREYLTSHEVSQLRAAARQQEYGHRNDTLILIMFRHGLRPTEAAQLRWEQLDLKQGFFHVKRLKRGKPSTHPMRAIELRALRQLLRDYPDSSYVFVSERGSPLTDRSIRHIVATAGEAAKIGFPVHAQMLRHSTGFYLANKGHDTRAIQAYLGHANIKNTVIYTELAPQRFNNFWED
jgi:type 1 fimbriae regulatory protein FimB/type 1 fimbriae regulatory protein FimE